MADKEHLSSDEDDMPKSKGVEGLIKINNPNRVAPWKKIEDVDVNEKVILSKKQKNALQKQKNREVYQKKHEAWQTDQARKDLARLAIVKREREEAALKRKENAPGIDAAK
jgi:predicted acetyltransferase